MNKFYLYTIAMAVAILFNCNQTNNPVSGTQKIEYPQGGSTASAFIKVLDARTGVTLNNIIVSIEGVESCSTNAKGIAYFRDLRIGDYILTASGSGYETVTSKVTIHADSSNSTVPMALQTSIDLMMYRKGVVVRGQVYYKKDKTLLPVAQQVVELVLSPDGANFVNKVKTVKTLPNGSFYLDSIPETIRATLRVKNATIGGVVYIQNESLLVNTGHVEDTITCLPVVLQPSNSGYFTILSDNTDSIKDTGSLLITFSLPVDTLKSNLDSIYVYEGSAPQGRILLKKQWNKTATAISMKPYDGIWKQGVFYIIVISRLYSTTGEVLYTINPERTFYVISTGIPTDVKNLQLSYPLSIDYSTLTVMLQWSRLPGASGYEIYNRVKGDSIWTNLSNTFSSIDTIKSVSIPGAFTNGRTVDVFVLGVNNGKRSNPETATILTLRDNVRPKVTSGSYVFSVYDCNNISNFAVLRQFPSMIQFSEPMDTMYKPVFIVKEGSYGSNGDTSYTLPSDSIKYNWLSLTSLQPRAIIPALKNASYDSVIVDLQNCKDLSGNSVSFPDSLGIPVLPVVIFVTR